MSDFKSWEEVKDWLQDPDDNWQTVTYHSWTFSKSYMQCHSDEPCCSDDYETVEDAVEAIKDYSGDRLHLVSKDD